MGLLNSVIFASCWLPSIYWIQRDWEKCHSIGLAISEIITLVVIVIVALAYFGR